MKLDLISNKAQKQGSVNPNDEFYTPVYAIIPLLKNLKPNSTIWCPFDTCDSNYVKVFVENGHKVLNTHIESGFDFFETEMPMCDYIISNPPYSIKYEVFKRLFELKKPFAMLVGVVGLFESSKRFNLFKSNNFEIMYFDKRVSYFNSYLAQKPSLNPPFSSVYVCSGLLQNQIEFENILK